MIRNCPICGRNKKTVLYKQKFAGIDDLTYINGYDVVVCDFCGAGFADDLPSQNEVSEYYRVLSKYETKDQSQNYNKKVIKSVHNPLHEHFFRFIKDYVNYDSVIADFGCGSGELLTIFKDYGFKKIIGVDPSKQCVEQLIHMQGISAIQSDIEHIDDTNKFDCIILSCVLEHIIDVQTVIKKVYKLLNAHGVFFIVVPDGSKFSLSKDGPFQQFSIEHVNYFSPKSLENLLKSNKFSLEATSDVLVNDHLDSIAWWAVFAVFRKDTIVEKFETDDSTMLDLKQYINQSKINFSEINKIFISLAESQEPIIVWGIGTFVLHTLKNGDLSKCNIVAFVDSNPKYQGRMWNNIKIMAPNEIQERSEAIFIGSYQYTKEIRNSIRTKYNMKNRLISLI